MLEVGSVFQQRYRIDTLLGEGGMGRVYRAYDLTLRRNVALKALRLDLPAGATGHDGAVAEARLLREARAVAALAHPNIVAIYDVGQMAGIWYIVMELAEGTVLRAFVGDARVALADKLRWMSAVARALSAAHERGIVHRDVKPDNVMICRDGSVKVLDFGIAKWVDQADSQVPTMDAPMSELTGAGRIVGTPRFMSPEQVEGGALDARSDQFSWALVAYELLSGRSPWSTIDRSSDRNILETIRSRYPAPLSEVAKGVPVAVEAAIWRALAKEPERRFARMAELSEILDDQLARLTVAQGASGAPASDAPTAPRGSVGVPTAPMPSAEPPWSATQSAAAAPPSSRLPETARPPPSPPSTDADPSAPAGVVIAPSPAQPTLTSASPVAPSPTASEPGTDRGTRRALMAAALVGVAAVVTGLVFVAARGASPSRGASVVPAASSGPTASAAPQPATAACPMGYTRHPNAAVCLPLPPGCVFQAATGSGDIRCALDSVVVSSRITAGESFDACVDATRRMVHPDAGAAPPNATRIDLVAESAPTPAAPSYWAEYVSTQKPATKPFTVKYFQECAKAPGGTFTCQATDGDPTNPNFETRTAICKNAVFLDSSAAPAEAAPVSAGPCDQGTCVLAQHVRGLGNIVAHDDQIAFTGGANGASASVWTVAIAGGAPRPLASHLNVAGGLSFVGGALYLTVRDAQGHLEVIAVAADGRSPPRTVMSYDGIPGPVLADAHGLVATKFGNPNQLLRADLDGTHVSVLATAYPAKTTMDAEDAYYADWGVVSKVDRSGGAKTVLVHDASQCSALALDDDHLYWATGGPSDKGAPATNGAIRRLPKAGGAATLIATRQWASALVADDEYLYWTVEGDAASANGAVFRAPKDGSGPPQLIAASQPRPCMIVVTPAYVVWGTCNDDAAIVRAPKPAP